MRRRVFILVLAAALAAAFAGIALGTSALTPIEPPQTPGVTDESQSEEVPQAQETEDVSDRVDAVFTLPCTSAQQDLNFANYWAGPTFNGLSVSAVIRRCDLPVEDEPVRANYVSYLYGDCIAADDEGCAPPIEVQTWPAQERNKETLTGGPDELQLAGTDTSVAGVPATRYEDGTRLEIYFPDVTVVVFGDDPARIDLFAPSLKQGPAVLAELAEYGITFTPACLGDVNYCVAQPITH